MIRSTAEYHRRGWIPRGGENPLCDQPVSPSHLLWRRLWEKYTRRKRRRHERLELLLWWGVLTRGQRAEEKNGKDCGFHSRTLTLRGRIVMLPLVIISCRLSSWRLLSSPRPFRAAFHLPRKGFDSARMSSWFSNRDPLHFIERDLITGPIIELRRARRFMRGNQLGIFHRAAGLKIGRDAGRPERVATGGGGESGRLRVPLHHPQDVGTRHGVCRDLPVPVHASSGRGQPFHEKPSRTTATTILAHLWRIRPY